MARLLKEKKDEPMKPVKVRCAYCKTLFVVDDKVRNCPSCHRLAIMPGQLSESQSEKRRFHLRRSMLAKGGAGSTMAMAFQDVWAARRFNKIMVVVGVIAIVGAVVFDTPAPVPYVPPTLEETAEHELVVMRVALERFERDCGRYPTTEEGLVALVHRPPELIDWDGHYVTLIRPDPWNHPYVYRCENGMITLLSLGADGIEGTADDIPQPRIPTEQMIPYLEKNETGWVTPGPLKTPPAKREKTF